MEQKQFTCCFSTKYEQNAQYNCKKIISPVALHLPLFQIGFSTFSRKFGNTIFERHLSRSLQIVIITIGLRHHHWLWSPPPGPMTFESELSIGASALISSSPTASQLPADHQNQNQLIFFLFCVINAFLQLLKSSFQHHFN